MREKPEIKQKKLRMNENTLSDTFFINERKKLNQRYKMKSLVFVLGILSLIGWIGMLILIFSAFFFDRSALLGFSEDLGIAIVSFNRFKEIVFEMFLFSGFFILAIIITVYLFVKVR